METLAESPKPLFQRNLPKFPTWELTETRPRSISGVELEGSDLSKFAHIDESGISVNESFIVVASVITDSKRHWIELEQYLDDLVEEFVPAEHRSGFVFHAHELFHRNSVVPKERCHDALKALLGIPLRFYLAIAFGYLRKIPPQQLSLAAPQKLKAKQASFEAGMNHSIAFTMCALGIETFMLHEADAEDVVTLVAEQNTNTRDAVKEAFNAMKGKNLSDRERMIFEFVSGMSPGRFPLRKIKDTVHMVTKHESPFVQIADACAMVIRRYLEGRPNIEEFASVLSGGNPEAILMRGQALDPETPAGYNILSFKQRPKPSLFATWRKIWQSWIHHVRARRKPGGSA